MAENNGYGLTMLLFGPAKAGKSWCGDTTPAPRVVLDAEAGSRFTNSRKTYWNPVTGPPPEPDGTWDTALVSVRDFRTVQKSLEWMSSGKHPFRSLVCDSISEIQQRAVDDIAGTRLMQTADWGQLLRVVSDTVRKFRDLVTNPVRPLDAVVFIAMARDRNGIQEPYVQGQLATTLPYYLDICGCLMPVTNPETGEIVRRLLIGSFPGYLTGERVGGRLGTYIDNPDISKMVDTIRKAEYTAPVSAGNGAIQQSLFEKGIA